MDADAVLMKDSLCNCNLLYLHDLAMVTRSKRKRVNILFVPSTVTSFSVK